MTGFVNPFARRNPSDMSHTARIKDWIRTELRLPEDVVVSVNEVTCRDAGCADVETVIGILQAERPIQMLRIERPIAHVTKDHIALAIHTLEGAVEAVAVADEEYCAKAR